jgi:DNA-directed RNA polymerase subunit L
MTLVDELALLRVENVRLKERLEVWEGLRDIRIDEVRGTGFFQANFIPFVAEFLYEWFEEQGGVNYVEMRVNHPASGPLVLTLQRAWGKTPHEMRTEKVMEMAARQDELEQALDDAFVHAVIMARAHKHYLNLDANSASHVGAIVRTCTKALPRLKERLGARNAYLPTVEVDETLPPGVVQFRDPLTGKVAASIVNVGTGDKDDTPPADPATNPAD